MGIRRRRKKLTTVINSVDRRLRSVEYRSVPTRLKPATVTAANIAPGTIPPSDPKDSGATGATSSTTAPVEFAVITAATYSAANITGTVDRVDITTATNHGLLVGNKVTIYGLNNHDVNLDGTYTITEVPTSTTLRFSRGLTGYYQSVINLDVQATVSSRYCSTTTATLTLSSSTHGFVVGDTITVSDVPTDTFFNGDFKVTAVDGANVSYNFASAQTAISITSSTGYIKSVLHKYAIIGDTWIDTSVTPNTVKIWDGLTWTSPSSIPDGVIIDDHMAPKPPTGLSAIVSGYYDPTSGNPAVAATLSWYAPTENADGSPLTDLAGYKVFYRYTKTALDGTTNGSVGYEPPGQETIYGSPASSDATVTGTFTWNNTFTSTTPAVTITTSAGTLNNGPVVLDIVKGKKTALWTVKGLADGDPFTISWNSSSSNKYGSGSISGTIGSTEYTTIDIPATTGFSISGALHITSQTKSTTAATPDITTDIPSTNEVAPDIQWINAGDTNQTSMSMRDFTVASTIEFAVQAYDSSKMNYSPYSDSLTVETGSPAIILSPPSIPTAEARLGTITVKWDGFDDQGNVPPPYLAYTEVHLSTVSTFTPDSTTLKGRMERLGYNELVIANLVYGTTYYAKLVFVSTTGAATQGSDPSTGVVVVPLVNTDLVANTLTTWPFSGKVVSAGSLADGSINASTLFGSGVVTQAAISANAIGADQIAAGAVVAGKIGADAVTATTIAAGSITAGKIATNAITADKIEAGAVTASKIAANTITADQISSSYVYAGYINADKINAGTLTGFTIRTSNDSTAVTLSAATNALNIKVSGTDVAYVTGSYDPSWGYGAIFGYGTPGDIYSSNVYVEADSTIMRGPNNVAGVAAWRNGGSGYLDVYADTQMSLAAGYITMNNDSTDAVVISGSVTVNGTTGLYVQNLIDARGKIDAQGRIAAPSFAIWGIGTVINTDGTMKPVSTTTTSAANVRQASSFTELLRFVSSSARYKNTIVDINSVEELDPKLLLDLPVRAFKYNTDYLSNAEDSRYDMLVPGFIAEEVEQFYGAAVDYNEDNVPENWNEKMMVPSMLALIQDLYLQIDELKKGN
jgi:hypothetical protein